MKIEMGESLLASWLKHVKGCKIVETNWKKSGNWEMNDKNDLSDYVFEKIKQYPELFDAFKSDLHQTLKQAEIDVIGINFEENTIYMIDVAFHEKGLNYGSKIETRDRVIKKLLRSYLMALQIFPNFKYEILFVSPKVNHSTEELITDSFTIFKTDFINDKVNFDYISNEEFKTKILIPVLEKTKKESDTAELFLRSVKMMTMFNMLKETSDEKKFDRDKYKTNRSLMEKRTENGMKIGQFVQFKIKELFAKNLLSLEEIKNLQSKEYSKIVFDLNFELLRSHEKSPRDDKGKNRYYLREMFCGNYYLTSQWFASNWEPFLKWVEKIENNHALQ